MLPVRNYCSSFYLKNILKVSKLLKRTGSLDQVIEICEKAFLIEPAGEDLHLLYMNTLLEEGKVERARAHYEQITTTMYREAGVKPSKALRNIYKKIKTNYETGAFDFADVQEIRKNLEKIKGAMVCDPDVFFFLCGLEKGRAERSGNNIYLGVFSLNISDIGMPSSAEFRDALEGLESLLLNSLRKGDVISRWNKNQFVLLLTDMDQKQAHKILGRIKGRFEKNYLKGEGILHGTLHSLSSGESQ